MKEQSREHLKPLIKWPGGKSSEIGQLIGFIPSFERYVEPFVGGGAQPSLQASLYGTVRDGTRP